METGAPSGRQENNDSEDGGHGTYNRDWKSVSRGAREQISSECSEDERGPNADGAAPKLSRLPVTPRGKLRHEGNPGQRQIENENPVPRWTGIFQRAPNHRYKTGGEIEKDVRADPHRVDCEKRQKRRRFPFQ